MKKPKMIIFDYGNTLIYESGFFLENAYAELYKHITKNPDAVSLQTLTQRGKTLSQTVKERALANDMELHEHSFYNALFHSLNIEFSLSYTEIETVFWEAIAPCKAMPGIKELLLYLDKSNIRTAVISNISFSMDALKKRIDTYLPENKFEFFIASSEYGGRKPESLLFETALKKAALPAREVWHCGDNKRADILGAASLGITPVLFTSPLGCPYDNDAGTELKFEYTSINEWHELTAILETL